MGGGVARETVRAAAEQEPRVRGDYPTLRRLAQARTGWVGAPLLVLPPNTAKSPPVPVVQSPESFGPACERSTILLITTATALLEFT